VVTLSTRFRTSVDRPAATSQSLELTWSFFIYIQNVYNMYIIFASLQVTILRKPSLTQKNFIKLSIKRQQRTLLEPGAHIKLSILQSARRAGTCQSKTHYWIFVKSPHRTERPFTAMMKCIIVLENWSAFTRCSKRSI
jgi:hypothetical protein